MFKKANFDDNPAGVRGQIFSRVALIFFYFFSGKLET